MKIIFATACSFTLLTVSVWSQSESINRKLDLIIEKLGGLEERVTNLESSNETVRSEISQVEKRVGLQENQASIKIPNGQKEKDSFISNLRKQLQSDEDKSSGPWAEKSNWKKLRRNLTRFQVREILGNPHEVRTSLDPRIDQVYCYDGDLNADGKKEVGKVNFYRDRMTSFQSPFFK